jgi:hypothetical protein
MSDPKVTATVTTPPPKPVNDPRVVTLTMPYDVAVTLLDLTEHVGGTRDTYRTHTDSIADAIVRACVDPAWPNVRFDSERLEARSTPNNQE